LPNNRLLGDIEDQDLNITQFPGCRQLGGTSANSPTGRYVEVPARQSQNVSLMNIVKMARALETTPISAIERHSIRRIGHESCSSTESGRIADYFRELTCL
jgi:hypothetical protein